MIAVKFQLRAVFFGLEIYRHAGLMPPQKAIPKELSNLMDEGDLI